jgi:hypothetical protein
MRQCSLCGAEQQIINFLGRLRTALAPIWTDHDNNNARLYKVSAKLGQVLSGLILYPVQQLKLYLFLTGLRMRISVSRPGIHIISDSYITLHATIELINTAQMSAEQSKKENTGPQRLQPQVCFVFQSELLWFNFIYVL